VTGFFRSNILHHGLVVPEGSLYLPIKEIVETIKYQGNKNGMGTGAYARSVVEKLMSKQTPKFGRAIGHGLYASWWDFYLRASSTPQGHSDVGYFARRRQVRPKS
jgi:hypothetical protein